MAHNFHSNAAALIIAAAKQSGLLDEIARALCLCDKVPNPTHMDCPACELLSDLADHFAALQRQLRQALRTNLAKAEIEAVREKFKQQIEANRGSASPD